MYTARRTSGRRRTSRPFPSHARGGVEANRHQSRGRVASASMRVPQRTPGEPSARHLAAGRLYGDVSLGHRALSSTGVYLRLAIEDLRGVGLEVPKTASASALLDPGWEWRIPKIRSRDGRARSPARFRSRFGSSIQHYLKTKRASARKYVNEAWTLLH